MANYEWGDEMKPSGPRWGDELKAAPKSMPGAMPAVPTEPAPEKKKRKSPGQHPRELQRKLARRTSDEELAFNQMLQQRTLYTPGGYLDDQGDPQVVSKKNLEGLGLTYQAAMEGPGNLATAVDFRGMSPAEEQLLRNRAARMKAEQEAAAASQMYAVR